MNKYIFITGAGRGLGLVMTKQLAEEGHKIIAVSKNISSELRWLSEKYSDRLIVRQKDVSKEENIGSIASLLSEKKIKLDIIINNAAVHLESEKSDITEADFSVYPSTFMINSAAPLMAAKHFLPYINSPGLFVSISSEAGSIADCSRISDFSYCMSKSALNMGMRILQNRLKEDQIKVLLIHPGWVRTDMGGQNADLSPEESAESVIRQIFKPHKMDGPMYIDWTGKEMKW